MKWQLVKRKNIGVFISWTAVLFWMLLIFNLSSQPATQSDKLSKGVTKVIVETARKVAPKVDFDISNHIIRKNAHFFAYLVLGVLLMNASGVDRVKWTLLICVLYAVSDELHQFFVPNRGPGVNDVFIDSAGACVGILVYLGLSRIRLIGRCKS